VEGLKNTPPDAQPIMGMVFYGFRIMYGIAILMFAVGTSSLWLRWKRRLFTTKWFLRFLVAMTPSGIVATLGGWYLAETGRQPWVIFGMLRTIDAVSPVPAQTLLATLIAFVCIYAFFMAAFLFFVARIIRRGPDRVLAQAEASGSLKNAFRPHVLDSKNANAAVGR
jgi:cytochrome d ubiquinol oxidase subunit I